MCTMTNSRCWQQQNVQQFETAVIGPDVQLLDMHIYLFAAFKIGCLIMLQLFFINNVRTVTLVQLFYFITTDHNLSWLLTKFKLRD